MLFRSLIITILIITLLILHLNKKKKKLLEYEAYLERERLKEEVRIRRERYNNHLGTFLERVIKANLAFRPLVSESRYVSNYDAYLYYKDYKQLYSELPLESFNQLANDGEVKKEIEKFKYIFENYKTLVANANKGFVEEELREQKEFFDDIEGKKLDLQQRNAIVVDEDNHLVVAGAGTGKTTTIAGKVKYLVEKKNVTPNEMLLLAFTRKAADEMRERIKSISNASIEVKTFHKLGLDIISKATGERPNIFALSEIEKREIFASFIANAKCDVEYYSNLIDFLIYWFKPYKDDKYFESEAEKTSYLKDQKIEGLKLTNLERLSYKWMQEKAGIKFVVKKLKEGSFTYRERLKSQEEVLIANFLFINNIQYSYEERYHYKTASKTFGQYKPDFYLPEYEIYIEHFGIDKDGNVPAWFNGDEHQTAKEKYNAGIAWKRAEHRKYNTVLVESFSWEKKEGVLLENLKKKLVAKGVKFNPMTEDEIWQYLEENTPEEIDGFTVLVTTFLELLKSNNTSVAVLKQKAEEKEDDRALLFLKLFEPIFNLYNNFLKQREEIDFSDMINNASIEVQKSTSLSPYKYIIIDEFQDVSLARYQLIKSFLDKNAATKLFCVGDDWQSIFRFAGSDIGIFTDFDEYFKPTSVSGFDRKTYISYIENTYRFNNKFIELTSNFILKNPNQISKSLKSKDKSNDKPFTIINYEKSANIIKPLYEALDSIALLANGKQVSVKLLGRYKRDIKIVKETRALDFKYDTDKKDVFIYRKHPNLSIEFYTVHAAKGLEADYVVILNGSSGKYGFPSEIADDPLLNFLLSKSDQFVNGEERRVFYVALTRARKHVYILSNEYYQSKFVKEIDDKKSLYEVKCEWCDSALIERKGPHDYFYVCSNYDYCNFKRDITSSDFIEIADRYNTDKEYKKAIEYYSKAIELGDQNYETFYKRGRCYEEDGKHQQALQDYSSAINLKSNHHASYYWRGSVNYDLKNYEDALHDWQKAYTHNIDSDSLYWIAKTQFELKQFSDAIVSVNKFIAKTDDNMNAYILRGECLAEAQQFKSAFEDWQKSKRLGYDNIDFYFNKYKVNEHSKNTSNEIVIDSTNIDEKKSAINEAIENDQNIKFDYQKSMIYNSGESSRRTMKPTSLIFVGASQSLCVKGHCYMRREERVFALSRISNLVVNPNEVEFWEE